MWFSELQLAANVVVKLLFIQVQARENTELRLALLTIKGLDGLR